MIAKHQVAVSVFAVPIVLVAATFFAAPSIPDLVGTWSVRAEGAVLLKGNADGLKTHHAGVFSTLVVEATVMQRQGRVIHGTYTSTKATESTLAGPGPDNRGLCRAGEDGFGDAKDGRQRQDGSRLSSSNRFGYGGGSGRMNTKEAGAVGARNETRGRYCRTTCRSGPLRSRWGELRTDSRAYKSSARTGGPPSADAGRQERNLQ